MTRTITAHPAVRGPRTHLLSAALVLLVAAAPARSQEGTLDLMDGETLYQGGWLMTLGYSIDRKEKMRSGGRHVADPLHSRRTDHEITFAAHYGVRHDVQLSLITPYVARVLEVADPAGPDRYEGEGLGDIALAAKWRFWRWDAPHKALNVAVIGGLEFPSGDDDQHDHGVLLEPELQPGSGTWDPMLGIGVTYEPYRWRFNGAFLHRFLDSDADRFEDDVFAELAVGNRFWLEPYPGPFMRADLVLRYRRQEEHSATGSLPDAGRDLVTAGANLAFRPRPSLDFQIGFEVPIYEHVSGTQLSEEFSVFAAIGFRF